MAMASELAMLGAEMGLVFGPKGIAECDQLIFDGLTNYLTHCPSLHRYHFQVKSLPFLIEIHFNEILIDSLHKNRI